MTEEFKQALEQDSRTWKHRVKIGDNEWMYDDIQSLSINENFNPTDDLKFGVACTRSCKIKFMLSDKTVGYDILPFTVQEGLLTSNGFEYVDMGVFYSTDKKTITTSFDGSKSFCDIQLLDKMSDGDIEFKPTFSLPTTDTDIVNFCAEKMGIEFIGKTLNCPINKIYEGTIKQTIGYMAGLKGMNAYITRDNKLDFSWYITPSSWNNYKDKTWQEIQDKTWQEIMRRYNY